MERLWFCEKSRWLGIWQFEHEMTPKQKGLLKSVSKNVKCREQILIHRERKEGMAHYVYALRLDDGNWLYLYLPSHRLFTDFSKLFWFFREVVCLLDDRGILVTGCKAGVNTKAYLRNTESKNSDFGKLTIELGILNRSVLCEIIENLPKEKLPFEACSISESHAYIDRNVKDGGGQEVVSLLRSGYYNFIVRNSDGQIVQKHVRLFAGIPSLVKIYRTKFSRRVLYVVFFILLFVGIYLLFMIFASPQLKFKIYEMFSV